jgi:hypothetical protein
MTRRFRDDEIEGFLTFLLESPKMKGGAKAVKEFKETSNVYRIITQLRDDLKQYKKRLDFVANNSLLSLRRSGSNGWVVWDQRNGLMILSEAKTPEEATDKAIKKIEKGNHAKSK